MARTKIIAGNWKMNKTPSQAVELIKELIPAVKESDADVVICTPAIDLAIATELTKNKSFDDISSLSKFEIVLFEADILLKIMSLKNIFPKTAVFSTP